MSSRAGRRTGALAAVGMVLSVALAGCGGEGEPEAETTSAVSSATLTVTPSPTKSTPPLSKFEDWPPVRVVRKFLRLAAEAVNANDAQIRRARPLLTPEGQGVLPQTIAGDLGLYYPGPIPFTPTRVDERGRNADVVGCTLAHGFALKKRGGKPASERAVIGSRFVLVRDGGAWKLDTVLDAPVDCAAVRIQGVEW